MIATCRTDRRVEERISSETDAPARLFRSGAFAMGKGTLTLAAHPSLGMIGPVSTTSKSPPVILPIDVRKIVHERIPIRSSESPAKHQIRSVVGEDETGFFSRRLRSRATRRW